MLPNTWFMSRCFKLSGSALSTGYSVFFFINSSDFGFLHSAPLILLSEEGVDFFFKFYFLRNMVAAKQKGSKRG